MIDSLNKKTLRDQLLYEINNSSPEVLELFYNYIQVLKESFKEKREEHHLTKYTGILTYEEGQKMIDCINQEFNNIEGEW